MEYVDLEKYAARMVELNKNDTGLKPYRLKAEQDRLAFEMHRILKPSIRRLAARKNMTRDIQEEIDQHTFIAICRALTDWDPELATFSTYVHWKVRAELQTLQHCEFPDRRRLAIPVKIKFIELDRPNYSGDETGSSTMADDLVDDTAEAKVEAAARKHMAMHTLERVFSHAIARQMQAYSVNQNDEQKIAARRHNLMRNRWMYLRRTLCLENYEQIAQSYGVSRERVRQIINSVDEEVRGQLPRFCKKTNEIIPATKMPPKEIHPSWDYMLIDFYMATGEDTRLFDVGSPMPTRVEPYDFNPKVEISAQTSEEMVAELKKENAAEIIQEDNLQIELPIESNVIPIQKFRRIARGATVAAIAGTMLSSAVAANAQSRAIPPEGSVSTETTITIEQPVKSEKSKTVAASKVKNPKIFPIVNINQIKVASPSWGIKIAEYTSVQQAQKEWVGQTKSWQWLRGLRAAYIEPQTGTQHGLAFGPLSERQAIGMCHEAKRMSKPCSVVPFGAVKTASKTGRVKPA